ncbi:hypothetical protein AB0I52_26085 [Streptomyces sp. NPDC050423]
MDTTVTRAFATASGIRSWSRTSTPLEATPTPPPQTTKRTKAATSA